MARKAILWKIREAKAEECEITSHKGFIPNKVYKAKQEQRIYDAVFLSGANGRVTFILGDCDLDPAHPFTIDDKPMVIVSARKCVTPALIKFWNTATNKTAQIHKRMVFKFPPETNKNEILQEIARIGFMTPKLEVYIQTDDLGKIPHFHIRNLQESFETCIEIKSNNYFLHGDYTGKLNNEEETILNAFVRSVPKDDDVFKTNYESIVYEWNKNNSKNKITIQKDKNGNAIIPNYITILPNR